MVYVYNVIGRQELEKLLNRILYGGLQITFITTVIDKSNDTIHTVVARD